MIRKATIQDAEAIALVLKESYNIDSISEGTEVFTEELAKGNRYLVCIEDGKLAGFVTWYVHGLAKHGLCELDRIAVLPDFRGKGVAKQLFDGLVDDAKKWYSKRGGALRKLYLNTHDDNPRAQKFYEKMGFSHEVTLKDHYYKGKDERVYSIFF